MARTLSDLLDIGKDVSIGILSSSGLLNTILLGFVLVADTNPNRALVFVPAFGFVVTAIICAFCLSLIVSLEPKIRGEPAGSRMVSRDHGVSISTIVLVETIPFTFSLGSMLFVMLQVVHFV